MRKKANIVFFVLSFIAVQVNALPQLHQLIHDNNVAGVVEFFKDVDPRDFGILLDEVAMVNGTLVAAIDMVGQGSDWQPMHALFEVLRQQQLNELAQEVDDPSPLTFEYDPEPPTEQFDRFTVLDEQEARLQAHARAYQRESEQIIERFQRIDREERNRSQPGQHPASAPLPRRDRTGFMADPWSSHSK